MDLTHGHIYTIKPLALASAKRKGTGIMKWKVLSGIGLAIAVISLILQVLEIVFKRYYHSNYFTAGAALGITLCCLGNWMITKEIRTFIRAVVSKIIPGNPDGKIDEREVYAVMIQEGSGAKLIISARARGLSGRRGFFLVTPKKKPGSGGSVIIDMIERPLRAREFCQQMKAMAARCNKCTVEYSDLANVWKSRSGMIDLTTVEV